VNNFDMNCSHAEARKDDAPSFLVASSFLDEKWPKKIRATIGERRSFGHPVHW
jgi:hypothetical protein